MAKDDGNAPRPAEAIEAEPARHAPLTPKKRLFAGARRWVLELGLFAGVYFALTAFQERNLLPSRTMAPSFELAGLNGERMSLDSLRGKRAVLHFWATWCSVCRREQGALKAVESELGKDEVLYTVVADADDLDHVRRFVADEHITYPVLLGNADVIAAFHVGAFPTSYYIDKSGRIGGHTVGMSTRFSIRAHLGLLD